MADQLSRRDEMERRYAIRSLACELFARRVVSGRQELADPREAARRSLSEAETFFAVAAELQAA